MAINFHGVGIAGYQLGRLRSMQGLTWRSWCRQRWPVGSAWFGSIGGRLVGDTWGPTSSPRCGYAQPGMAHFRSAACPPGAAGSRSHSVGGRVHAPLDVRLGATTGPAVESVALEMSFCWRIISRWSRALWGASSAKQGFGSARDDMHMPGRSTRLARHGAS